MGDFFRFLIEIRMGSIKENKFGILRRPLITEKAAVIGSLANCVVFDVHLKANKTEIKSAVENVFEVKVKSVRTMNYLGKVKRKGKHVGREKSWKKAYVYLKEGNTIDFVEGL